MPETPAKPIMPWAKNMPAAMTEENFSLTRKDIIDYLATGSKSETEVRAWLSTKKLSQIEINKVVGDLLSYQ